MKYLTVVAGGLALSANITLAAVESVETEAGAVTVESLAEGLDHPWGMAFLPDGRLLVTERAGRLRLLSKDQQLSDPLEGVPDVVNRGQGGLLDVALDPDFESNRYVYLSFAEPGDSGSTTALGRGRLEDDRLQDFEVIFREEPRISDSKHFGGRIVFDGEGRLFLTLADRFQFDPAQDLSNHIGTIVRLNRDGSVPDSNPFVDQEDARDEIWSYGHRNIESAAIDPRTGHLWVAEMGPMGGDELNRPQAGENYGWPVVSWGKHYSGEDISDPDTRPDLADAVKQWTPVISPSGMQFYTGDLFPEWQGSALIGGMSAQGLVRVAIDGEKVTAEERIPLGERIRDVEQAPDGSLYLLTDQDDGEIWRMTPLD